MVYLKSLVMSLEVKLEVSFESDVKASKFGVSVQKLTPTF